MMFVDSDLLRSGGTESQQAAAHAHQAAEHLLRVELPSRIFGDFAAAEEFHALTASLDVHHTRLLLRHRDTLGSVGEGAVAAAAGFTEMEETNTASVRAVRCNSAT